MSEYHSVWSSELENIYRSINKEWAYFRNTGDFRTHPGKPFSQVEYLGMESLWFVSRHNNEKMRNRFSSFLL